MPGGTDAAAEPLLVPTPLPGGNQIAVWSVAGHWTCVWLRIGRVTVAVDMGACPVRAVSADHVFFTHGHIDHVGAVVTHANLRRLSGLSGATYHADEALAASVGDLLRISEVMCGGPLPHTVRAFQAGVDIPLSSDVVATALPTQHRVPSHAVAFWRLKRRLKPQYQGLSGAEIAERRKRGEDVTDVDRQLDVVVSGDTTIDFLDTHPVCYTARLWACLGQCLVVECTYVTPDVDVALARERGHIHLAELVSRAHLIQAEAIWLTHFSSRHSPEAVRDAVDATWPKEQRSRVHLALDALASLRAKPN